MAKKPTLDEMRLALSKGKTKHEHAHEKARLNAIKMLGLHEKNTAQDRAKAMGFDLETFHGTDAPDIESLDPERTKIIKGVFSTTNPKMASRYAEDERKRAKEKTAPNVLPLLIKSASHETIPKYDINTINAYKNRGAKGVYRPEMQTAVTFDPSHIRSRFAAFDPEREHDTDLLAAKGGKVLPHHQREANKAKFLEPSKVKHVMYHGTDKNFNEFKTHTFLTSDSEFAKQFPGGDKPEGQRILPVHVQVKNPWDYENRAHVRRLTDELRGEGIDPDTELGIHHGDWQAIEHPTVMETIKKLGHDAFYVDEGGKNLMVYNPRKIKSAIGNRGTYDVNNPDITMAKGGSVEPKKTVKAYKLFRVHEKHPGKLFPLFVDANTPVEMGKWVDAKIGEQSGEKVKSKIGPLAMRPGWHAGDLPVATHIGEKSHPKLTAPDTRPHNHAWAEVEMPNDVDWQTEANKRGMNKKGELISKHAHITDQLPVGGHYRYKTNPNMTGNWLIGGAMKVNRILSDAEVKKINDRHGVADLPRAEPFKKKTFGFASGGVVAPESWVAEEHIHYTAPVHIKKKLDEMKAEMAQKVAHEKEYHKAIRHMPFDQIPTLEDWKKGQPTHAHHLEIEERPL